MGEERKRKISGIVKLGIVFGILFLPTALFYFFIYTGVHHARRLPFYGPKTIVEKQEKGKTVKDTVFHEVPSFTLPALYNNPTIDSAFLAGRIYIACFLEMEKFSNIPPQVTYTISEALSERKNVKALTFFMGYDPQQDTLPKPSEITDRLAAYDTAWYYLPGPDSLVKYIRDEGYFKTGEGENPHDLYSVVLIDREGRVRGYYNPVIAEDIKRLKEEIVYLEKEYSLNYKTHRFFRYDDKPEQKRP